MAFAHLSFPGIKRTSREDRRPKQVCAVPASNSHVAPNGVLAPRPEQRGLVSAYKNPSFGETRVLAWRSCSLLASVLLFVLGNCGFALAQSETAWPRDDWPVADPTEHGFDHEMLHEARAYAETGGGSGMIIHRGRQVLTWGDLTKKYDLKSTTKSIGVTALGLALADGKLKLGDYVREHHPNFVAHPELENNQGWLDEVTIAYLATQTAGFGKRGGYEPILFEPGTAWHYSDSGPNWLAECVTLAYQQDIEQLLFDRVFTPIGITADDLHWRNNAYRPHKIEGIPRREFGSGVHANVDAMARLGTLYLHRGQWQGEQLLPASFVELVRLPPQSMEHPPVFQGNDPSQQGAGERWGPASAHYGFLWWNNADGTLADVPRDAYWSWGLFDSLIVVIPSLDIVVARAGKSWSRQKEAAHYDVLEPFLTPIAKSVNLAGAAASPPYPPSPVIRAIEWAPVESIVRRASGSDNWPITWADDGALYTAYGDGWGFQPKVEKKLSLGFAKITGGPLDFVGTNIRSPSGERVGQGSEGAKASGMLMIDGTLYMLVRNVENSQLAWSTDYARTWQFADWKFETSFGAPTFLNFGQNYARARDEFVYLYSHDHDSAYESAHHMVLARVPHDELRERPAYEFFAGKDRQGAPQWTRDITKRRGVFAHAGRCYRSGITYNAPLKRYLWCQVLPESTHPQGQRFQGGFGIYDAPEPWGPWTTVFFTTDWDVGPGETSSLPTKWISVGGKTVHLVFSGDDHFSVRKGLLQLREE